MIQVGKNITVKDDLLQKTKVIHLFHTIKKSDSELEQNIRRLRTIATLDKQQYTKLKRQLPYVVCGIFNPPFRRSENFAWIQHFILDVDHISNKNISPEALREKLQTDERVELIFISPGGDGLKIMFMLTEKCFDRAKFSLFYKVFARIFSRQNDLDQVIDPRTSDVTRACFLATDYNIYYNPSPVGIEMKSFVDFNNPLEAKMIADEIRLEEKSAEPLPEVPDEKIENGPDDLILGQIRKTLNPSARIRPARQIYVPEELEKTIEIVKEKMNSLSINVDNVRDIHYGKKFYFSLALRKAEINLFYGKRGFSVVISPRAGTDRELNEICSSLMQEMFLPG